jgi:hypothetical protein
MQKSWQNSNLFIFFLFSTMRKKLKDKKCSELAAQFTWVQRTQQRMQNMYLHQVWRLPKQSSFFGTKMQVNYSNVEGCQTKQISIAKQSSFYHVTTRKRSIARRLKLKLPHSAISIQWNHTVLIVKIKISNCKLIRRLVHLSTKIYIWTS